MYGLCNCNLCSLVVGMRVALHGQCVLLCTLAAVVLPVMWLNIDNISLQDNLHCYHAHTVTMLRYLPGPDVLHAVPCALFHVLCLAPYTFILTARAQPVNRCNLSCALSHVVLPCKLRKRINMCLGREVLQSADVNNKVDKSWFSVRA